MTLKEHKYTSFCSRRSRFELCLHDFSGNSNNSPSMIDLFQSIIDNTIFLYAEDFDYFRKGWMKQPQYWIELSIEEAEELIKLYDSDYNFNELFKSIDTKYKFSSHNYDKFQKLFKKDNDTKRNI